jgi:hypothetical protein
MADVNGIGRVDLLGLRETGTFVALGLGNGTFGTSIMRALNLAARLLLEGGPAKTGTCAR